MCQLLELDLHLGLDVVQILCTFLNLVSGKLKVLSSVRSLLLCCPQNHVFLLDLLLSDLLVLFESREDRVLLRLRLLKGYQLFLSIACLVFCL